MVGAVAAVRKLAAAAVGAAGMRAERRLMARTRPRPWWRRVLRFLAWALLVFVVASVAVVATFRFVPVPTSAFMIARHVEAMRAGRDDFELRHQWVPYERIAPDMAIAVVAAEDQRFPHHHGFDLDAIADALEAAEDGSRMRGASTISQQVAKNLFLWSGRSWVRKGLEAYFTVLLETLWSKRRILEVYLNIAEFSDGIYGVEAAARFWYHKPASQLTAMEAARLATVLPNPRVLRVKPPTRYVTQRAFWIQQQMRQLGGAAWLDSPPPQDAAATRPK
jgi:monofunctional biosynthetic peptidoglycan transglycosylase